MSGYSGSGPVGSDPCPGTHGIVGGGYHEVVVEHPVLGLDADPIPLGEA